MKHTPKAYPLLICLTLLMSACRKDADPFGQYAHQQAPPPLYKEAVIIYLKDKGDDNFSVQKPSDYLSDRAIARRKAQSIAIDQTDLPVSATYLKKIVEKTHGKILNTSRWLNYAVVHLPENSPQPSLTSLDLPFVSQVVAIGAHSEQEEPLLPPLENLQNEVQASSTATLETLPPLCRQLR